MHRAIAGVVSEDTCSKKSESEGKKLNFSDSPITVQVEIYKTEEKKLTICLLNIQQSKLKRYKTAFKVQQNVCSDLVAKSQENKTRKPQSISGLLHVITESLNG